MNEWMFWGHWEYRIECFFMSRLEFLIIKTYRMQIKPHLRKKRLVGTKLLFMTQQLMTFYFFLPNYTFAFIICNYLFYRFHYFVFFFEWMKISWFNDNDFLECIFEADNEILQSIRNLFYNHKNLLNYLHSTFGFVCLFTYCNVYIRVVCIYRLYTINVCIQCLKFNWSWR